MSGNYSGSCSLPPRLLPQVDGLDNSNNAEDYNVGAPIGFGASSIVYAATYDPQGAETPTPVALKVLDLDRLPQQALKLLQRETQLMSLSKHPNVLRVRGTWMDGRKLCIALRLMNAGSAADVMRYGWVGGMEEEVIKCILKQALEGIKCEALPLPCSYFDASYTVICT
jgi:serine/threonine-protein kinase OSR1/STK39